MNAGTLLKAVAAAAVLGAVGSTTSAQDAMILTSTAFDANGSIPPVHTCDGDDISPPLSWTAVPDGTTSLVLIVDDPDAPDPANPRMTWVHWVLYNLAPEINGLDRGQTTASLPEGAAEGRNDWGQPGYRGPCPPIGNHRYFFKLYALDIVLPDLKHPTKAQVEAQMAGHVLGSAELVGRYQR